MTIGEAVSCAAAGRYSKAARDPWKIESDTPTYEPLPPHTVDNLKWTLQALISKDYCVSSTLGHRQVCVNITHTIFKNMQPIGYV